MVLGDVIMQFYYIYDRLESSIQSQILLQLIIIKENEY
jgi:hypothetical protein